MIFPSWPPNFFYLLEIKTCIIRNSTSKMQCNITINSQSGQCTVFQCMCCEIFSHQSQRFIMVFIIWTYFLYFLFFFLNRDHCHSWKFQYFQNSVKWYLWLSIRTKEGFSWSANIDLLLPRGWFHHMILEFKVASRMLWVLGLNIRR